MSKTEKELLAEFREDLKSEGSAKDETPKSGALNVQVSGSHYKDSNIQPIEYIVANNLPFIEGNVVKYITRWRAKGGLKDLQKVKHYIDLLIELEGLTDEDGE